MSQRGFCSPFAENLDNMIDLMVVSGGAESSYLPRARSFDTFCAHEYPECSELTEWLILEWLRPVMKKEPAVIHQRICFMNGFARYLNNVGKPAFMMHNRFACGRTLFVPYIFSDDDLTRLFHVIDTNGKHGKGYSRPIADEPRRFAIRLAFKNSSGTFVNSDILSWNEEWTDWQYISGAVIAPCAYTAIRYNVDYEKNVNYADFDGLTLYKEEFGNTFAYDEDGNVTAVKNLASKQAKAEYDDYNNLVSYVQPGRSETEKTRISYGSSDNEKKMRLPINIDSPTNIRTHNNYDSNGNLIQSYIIDAMDGTHVIDSHQTHTSDGNHIATKTDSRGKVVTYTTDLAKDTLTRVTDPNGQSVNYTYDALKRVTGTNATVDGNTYKNAYTYENDKLKTVAHNTTGDTPDVTYTFDYDEFGNPTTVKVGTQTLSTNVYTTTGDRTLTRVEYGNGGKVHYTRDDFRRVTGVHYDDATEPRFTYDYGANGQPAYVRDSELNRTVWMEYDTSERPTRVHLLENATNASIGTPKYVSTTSYDEYGHVASFKEKVNNSTSYETDYTYDVENRATQLRFGADSRKVNYAFDSIGRMTSRTLTGVSAYSTAYQYVAPDNTDGITTTPLVGSITQNGQNFSYTYDNVGNISSETRNGLTTTYVYDNLGQLIRVNDPHANKSTVYTYDRGGNMTSYSEYAYTTGTLGTAAQTVSYVYGDTNWKDKVTSIGGKAITYDAIGNPLTYDGWTFTWKAGRMLASMGKTGTNAQFTYDHNGMRIKKVVNGVTTNYTLNGKNIVHMTQGSNDLHFFYDAQNKPAMMRFNGTDYFYVYNLQGDVVAMIDANGTQVVEYHYDAWGAPIAKTGNMAATLGTVNPFRYRGYVYDEETGLYYLRSRYYNPVWKRFINADGYIANGKLLFGTNMFAYCGNNAVISKDSNGTSFFSTLLENLQRNKDTFASAALISQIDSPAIGPADVISGCIIAGLFLKSITDSISQSRKGNAIANLVAKENAITIEDTGNKKQAYFPLNPYDFSPSGLTRSVYVSPGSGRNGGIIKWEEPASKKAVFEWDEDYSNGAHYHAIMIEWDSAHVGTHYLPGEAVPEPWNSLYFGL